jgi:hypothetical protein
MINPYAIDEDYADIEKWFSLQSKKVQNNATIVSHELAQQTTMLHIDKITPKKFVPQMPRSAGKTEDNTTARVTVAPTVMGCYIGYARGEQDFEWGTHADSIKQAKFMGGYAICELAFQHCLAPSEKLVYDALRTGEHWLVPYNRRSLEYVPIKVGKLFLSEYAQVAKSGHYPLTKLTLYLEHDKPQGLLFSPNIRLEPGTYVISVMWDESNVKRSCYAEKDFVIKKIERTEYDQAKQFSANMLSLESQTSPVKKPAYAIW